MICWLKIEKMKKEEQKVRKIKDVTKLTGMIRALKATVAVGHGSLLTFSSTLSQKTQTSLSKNSNLSHQIRALSANLSRWWRRCVGGLVVAVVGWSDGCGAVVEWSRARDMGCGLWARDRRRRRVVCGWEQRPLSLLSLSDSLTSLFSISLTPILSLRLGFGLIWRGI